jgi:topoisomerase-4 subunit A
VEIEIKLPRGVYANEMIKALYGYTECEVALHSQIVIIKEALPWETTVDEILHFHVEKLQSYLQKELELERDKLLEKIFDKTLEQIFIENRLYKKIENVVSNDKIHDTVADSLVPFHPQLIRIPTHEDREKLLNIPIRRISKFDSDKNQEEIVLAQAALAKVNKDLKNIKKVSISYLQHLIKKYGKEYQRKTQIQEIEQIDKREIATKPVKVGFDSAAGFIGTKVASDTFFECTNYDKLLLMYKEGSYTVINIPEKQYVHREKNKVIYAGAADKKSVFSVVYRDPKTYLCYAKRFIITKFILDKNYNYFEEGMELMYITTQPEIKLELHLVPAPKQRISKVDVNFSEILIKGVNAKGNRLSNRPANKVTVLKTDKPMAEQQPTLFDIKK